MLLFSLLILLLFSSVGENVLAKPINIDLETIKKITRAQSYPFNTQSCQSNLATYIKGGNGKTGTTYEQNQDDTCGIGFFPSSFTSTKAISERDQIFLQSNTVPTVVDFGSRTKTVVVFSAITRMPAIEHAINKTVWGSDTGDISSFPNGWNMATLTAVWEKVPQEKEICKEHTHGDDYGTQYSFRKRGHRYIAIFANSSVSIYKTPEHSSWNIEHDDHPHVTGWQSQEEETDAVAAPFCTSIPKANAGPDKHGGLGDELCFKSLKSRANINKEVTIAWDIDDNGTIDKTDEEVCIKCSGLKTGKMRLYISDQCGCIDTDAVNYSCHRRAIRDSNEDEMALATDEIDEDELDMLETSLESGEQEITSKETAPDEPQWTSSSEEIIPSYDGSGGAQTINDQVMSQNNFSMPNEQLNPLGFNGFNPQMPFTPINNAGTRTYTSLSSSTVRPIMSTYKPQGCSNFLPIHSWSFILLFILRFFTCKRSKAK